MLEKTISEHVKQTEHGAYVALEQEKIQKIYFSLKAAIEKINRLGLTPIVLTSPLVRRHFKNLTSQMIPDLVVLSYNELDPNVEVVSDGMLSIETAQTA
jgi:flagellar biosynthesis protein FlhA